MAHRQEKEPPSDPAPLWPQTMTQRVIVNRLIKYDYSRLKFINFKSSNICTTTVTKPHHDGIFMDYNPSFPQPSSGPNGAGSGHGRAIVTQVSRDDSSDDCAAPPNLNPRANRL